MHFAKALPELISAAVLAALWIEPQRFDIAWFRAGVFALLLEFFAIHAGGFMAVTVTDPDATKRDRGHAIVSWALSVAADLGSVAATAILDVPAFGAGPEIRDAAGFDGKSTGLWEAQPHRAIAGAVLYFTIMGLSRPFLARGFAVRASPAASATQ